MLSTRPPLALIVEIGEAARRYANGSIPDLLASSGYTAFSYAPFTRTLTTIRPGAQRGQNVIFVRDLAQAQERVANAAPFRTLARLI
jgi:hypothetical protein